MIRTMCECGHSDIDHSMTARFRSCHNIDKGTYTICKCGEFRAVPPSEHRSESAPTSESMRRKVLEWTHG